MVEWNAIRKDDIFIKNADSVSDTQQSKEFNWAAFPRNCNKGGPFTTTIIRTTLLHNLLSLLRQKDTKRIKVVYKSHPNQSRPFAF